VLTLNLEQVQLPNGRVAELEIAHHRAAPRSWPSIRRVASAAAPVSHAAGGWITELPAGKLDDGEPPLQCAQRELAEEAGMSAARWDCLGQFYSSPGVLTEVIHVYWRRS